MWFSNKIELIVKNFNSSQFVDEIIIIDNKTENSIELSHYEKVIHIKNKKNIFVNPSWNLGVNLSKNENLIISNDDILINDIDRVLSNKEIFDCDLVGLDYENINKNNTVILKETKKHMERGFGCFLIIKKKSYVNIPEILKIWFGDNFLFNKVKNKKMFSCDKIEIELSKTIKNINGVNDILNQDKKNFLKVL
jgi:hypothetical protein